MIAIVDYGAGNLKSVKNALDYLKVDSIITSKAEDIASADKIIFPGVGNFGDMMKSLSKLGLVDVLCENILKKPYLGICLGLQALFEESEEAPGVSGLGIFKGKVKKFTCKLKIPQMGWNSVKVKKECLGLKSGSYFYFVHSYYVEPVDKGIVLCTTDYGNEFVSGIVQKKLFALQFHPERSGEIGLKVLRNFVEL